ncbi:hypothetical protein QJS04_geneDACA012218 [Acorus gramineus]|uniref:Uncharacterized protein n=1 Tax=Acorus gramineus TaxID=55184 RepID=A0AAV9BC90_ACOGR|nr:hypothetical protein QJS04_geneDACA012218 [Acorus gramineus]
MASKAKLKLPGQLLDHAMSTRCVGPPKHGTSTTRQLKSQHDRPTVPQTRFIRNLEWNGQTNPFCCPRVETKNMQL